MSPATRMSQKADHPVSDRTPALDQLAADVRTIAPYLPRRTLTDPFATLYVLPSLPAQVVTGDPLSGIFTVRGFVSSLTATTTGFVDVGSPRRYAKTRCLSFRISGLTCVEASAGWSCRSVMSDR